MDLIGTALGILREKIRLEKKLKNKKNRASKQLQSISENFKAKFLIHSKQHV